MDPLRVSTQYCYYLVCHDNDTKENLARACEITAALRK